MIGTVAFSEFFLLTLYLQEVLHYSPVQSGVAFLGFALIVVVISNSRRLIIGRLGVRLHPDLGLLTSAPLGLALPAAGARPLFLGSVPGLFLSGAGWASRSCR